MAERWTVTRPSGLSTTAPGRVGYESLLIHDDVTTPGRLRALALDGLQLSPPLTVLLQPDETLVLVQRHLLGLGPTVQEYTPSLILGARRPDGRGWAVRVTPRGLVLGDLREVNL